MFGLFRFLLRCVKHFFQSLQFAVLLYPRVFKNSFNTYPVLWVDLKDFGDKVLDFFRDSTAELHPFVNDVVVDLFDFFSAIRGMAVH